MNVMNLGEATNQEIHPEVFKACDELRNLYDAFELDYLITMELQRRAACHISECECRVPMTIVSRLSEIIETHKYRFLKKDDMNSEHNIYCTGLFRNVRDDFYAEKEHPIQHNKISRYARTADLDSFFNRLTEKLLYEIDNKENHLTHERHGCDCFEWLAYKFPKIRMEAFKLIRQKIGRHNTLATAFVWESSSPLLVAAAINGMNEHWKEVRKHMSIGYTRDRKRELRNYKMRLTTEMSAKYDQFMNQLQQNFPMLFLKDGAFDKENLRFMMAGEVGQCDGCNNYFSIEERNIFSCTQPLQETECMNSSQNTNMVPGNIHMCGPGIYRCWPHGNEEQRIYGPARIIVLPEEKKHLYCRCCIRRHLEKLNGGVSSVADNGFSIKCIDSACPKQLILDRNCCGYFPIAVLKKATELAINDLLSKIGHPLKQKT
uniref:Uncharacterized protein n=1 Tax=Acrobeloides nanus TaxID=290746 RepID=A0A914ELV5_9BILA